MRLHLITAPRTGSTWLLDCLVSLYNPSQLKHPVNWFNEPFNKDIFNNDIDIDKALDWMLTDPRSVIKNHIRHIFAHDLYASKEQITHMLSVDWYTILIIRSNTLEQSISYALSRTKNEWAKYTNCSVHISLDLFERSALAIWASINLMFQRPYDITYNKIIFTEDLIYKPVHDCNLITSDIIHNDMIGLTLPSYPKYQQILNYDELLEYSKTLVDALPKIPGVVTNGWNISKINWSVV